MANRIRYKSMLYYGIAHPFLTFEYRCFGYRKAGNEVSETSDGWDVNVTEYSDRYEYSAKEKKSITRTAYFARHEEYPKNILLMLLELLMVLVNWVRYICLPIALIGIILFLLLSNHEMLTALVVGIVVSYAISLVISILGLIVRKAFKLDDKMDDLCDENGWKRWSSYKDRDVR